MPIPQSREDLIVQMESSYTKLKVEIENLKEDDADVVCVDNWSIKQLLAIRAWWSETVVEWIEAGQRGENPELPAPGFKWNETPRLNDSIAAEASEQSYAEVCLRLADAYKNARSKIDNLSDHELLDSTAFEWAGKWPLSRWLSINTARQYKTARDYIRRVNRAN